MQFTPTDLAIADIKDRYRNKEVAKLFEDIYASDNQLGHSFAVLHRELNKRFTEINDRIDTTGHYWADNSRGLLSTIDEVRQLQEDLEKYGVEVKFSPAYSDYLDSCLEWLSPSGGSTIPEEFQKISIIRYEPIFSREETIDLVKKNFSPPLKLEGEGSFAIVHSYIDPDYGTRFARKRAKKDISTRDLERFKTEFATMKSLDYPYIVKVYRYDDSRNEYYMEFCDSTLRKYISVRNNRLSFATRRTISMQFLNALQYLHQQEILHRDLSLQNVLLKVYESNAAQIKLSDFGLVKQNHSTFTRKDTDPKGTIVDPQLTSFKDYSVINEIYPVGWILAYIFSGRESIRGLDDDIQRIVSKCTTENLSLRFQTVKEVADAVDNLRRPAPQT